MNAQQSDFLKNVVPAAQSSQRQYGIPASITIAQAILESAWGDSKLAQKANNFFGIKAAAHGDPDSYVAMPTSEVRFGHDVQELARFARYPSPIESFRAHAALIAKAPRYQPAMAACGNPDQFAEQLKACGYSTLPDYAPRLMQLVDEFDLTQYDIPAKPAQETT